MEAVFELDKGGLGEDLGFHKVWFKMVEWGTSAEMRFFAMSTRNSREEFCVLLVCIE